MRTSLLLTVVALDLLCLASSPSSDGNGKPYANGHFHGRIAYSADGNHNDPDDWIASPLTLAIVAEAGLKDRLVHFDYNCILPLTNPEWEQIHAESVLGAVDRYGFDKSRFFDCRQKLDAAVADIAKAVNASAADNPLYFIIAGPMEVPYLGIQKADPAKRQFVYCISHSRWNDGFASQYEFTFTKRSVIEQGVRWVQIQDQNRRLSFGRYGQPAAPEEFKPYSWMRDSHDTNVRWLWERMLVSTRPDPSDAGMTYFLVTGDEECDPAKLRHLVEEHQPATPIAARQQVRLEAENFRHLEGFVLEDRDRSASHQLNVVLTGTNAAGRIRTRFEQPYTALDARYDVEVRFMPGGSGGSRLALHVNGVPQGQPWRTEGAVQGWKSQTIADVPIRIGDEVGVEVQAEGGAAIKLDYVQLKVCHRGASAAPTSAMRTTDAHLLAESPLDGPSALPRQISMDPASPRWWMDEQIRLLQTNLRETDSTLDAQRLVQQGAEFPANTLLFNMGGIWRRVQSVMPQTDRIAA